MKQSRMPVFAERFLQLRGQLSQEEFAKKVGLSRPTVSFYESGERLPDALKLRQIAEKCQVSADWLLGLSDVQSRNEDIQNACHVTGLSESAVKRIQELDNIDYRKSRDDTGNFLHWLNAKLRSMIAADDDFLSDDVFAALLSSTESSDKFFCNSFSDFLSELLDNYVFTLMITSMQLYKDSLIAEEIVHKLLKRMNLKEAEEAIGAIILEPLNNISPGTRRELCKYYVRLHENKRIAAIWGEHEWVASAKEIYDYRANNRFQAVMRMIFHKIKRGESSESYLIEKICAPYIRR